MPSSRVILRGSAECCQASECFKKTVILRSEDENLSERKNRKPGFVHRA